MRQTIAKPQVIAVCRPKGGVELTIKGRSEAGQTVWIELDLSLAQAKTLALDLVRIIGSPGGAKAIS